MRKVFKGIGAAVFVLSFAACTFLPLEPEETYTVWTDSILLDEYLLKRGEYIGDGYYYHGEITADVFDAHKPPEDEKLLWKEARIYDWCIGRGFDASTAKKEKSWFITVKHGLIVVRNGEMIEMLLK